MRILVFSDIHANLVALETVLEHAGPADAYWFLGDAVGYGPDPNAVLERLRSLPHLVCLLGNHDAAVLGHLPLGWFNLNAQRALLWTQQVLTEENLAFLGNCSPRLDLPQVTLVHASLREPLQEYVISEDIARANLARLERPYAFIGHIHIPLAWMRDAAGQVQLLRPDNGMDAHALPLPAHGVLLNPGSVGQPRDGDPRAAYAVYDSEANVWTWHRVPYDIDAAMARFARVPALPPHFAQRLRAGR